MAMALDLRLAHLHQNSSAREFSLAGLALWNCERRGSHTASNQPAGRLDRAVLHSPAGFTTPPQIGRCASFFCALYMSSASPEPGERYGLDELLVVEKMATTTSEVDRSEVERHDAAVALTGRTRARAGRLPRSSFWHTPQGEVFDDDAGRLVEPRTRLSAASRSR